MKKRMYDCMNQKNRKKKMWKKERAVVYLGALLCACVIGCGSGETTSNDKTSSQNTKNESVKDKKEDTAKVTSTPIPTPAPALIATEGLKYILNADKESYSVASIGTATEVEIVIAKEYEGLPVTAIADDAFSGCKEIISVVIPDSITKIGQRAFNKCSKLYTVDIPESVTSILNEAFYNCTNLQGVTLPEGLEALGEGAFYKCESLTSVVIPAKIQILREQTFFGCTNLAEVIFAEGSCCTNIEYAVFKNCTALPEIVLPKSLLAIGSDAFYSCSSLEKVEMQEGLKAVNSAAFKLCKMLKDVKLPDSINLLGVSAFLGCELITEIIIPSGVTEVPESLFENCYALADITISDTVTSIGKKAFKNCTSLKNFRIPDSVTTLADVGYGSLEGCSNIESITLPVVDEEYALLNLFGLKLTEKSKLTETLTELIITKADSIRARAFYGVASLEKVTIKSAVTELRVSAFAHCSSLKEIIFEDTSKFDKIYGEVFRGCAFTSFDVPEGVTMMGSSVFDGCQNLVSVTFPSTLNYIETGIWDNMDSLTSIIFKDPNGWIDTTWDKSYDVSDPAVNVENFCKWNKTLTK